MAIAPVAGHQTDYESDAKHTTHTVTLDFTPDGGPNNVLIARVAADELVGTPSGWTELFDSVNAAELIGFWKAADVGDTAVAFTCASSNLCATVGEYTGVAESDAVDVTQSHSVTGTAATTTAAEATAQDDELVVGGFANDQNGNYTSLVGGTQVASLRSTGASPNVTLLAADFYATAIDTYEMHCTASGSVANSCALASFKAAAGPAAAGHLLVVGDDGHQLFATAAEAGVVRAASHATFDQTGNSTTATATAADLDGGGDTDARLAALEAQVNLQMHLINRLIDVAQAADLAS